VQAALGLVRGRLETRGVTLEVAAGLPVVYGDRLRLVEVIQNLVDKCGKIRNDLVVPRYRRTRFCIQ
jgi:hypothetical protein